MKILSSFEFWSAENFWNNFSRSRIGQKKDQQIDYSSKIKGALILNIENKWTDEKTIVTWMEQPALAPEEKQLQDL